VTEAPESTKSSDGDPSSALHDHFIVCGLGRMGQHCIEKLQQFADCEFQIEISAIDKTPPEVWEIEEVPQTLGQRLIIGDCRRADVLEKAGICDCRAILLVTSNETVNIEAAIAARKLNPDVHLVVRSGKQNLNQLLQQQLGSFVALEASELPAAAFALAGMGQGTIGLFSVEGHQFRVVEERVREGDIRFEAEGEQPFLSATHRLLSLPEQTRSANRSFFQWPADCQIAAGDPAVYVEWVKTPGPERRPQVSLSNSAAPQAPSLLQVLFDHLKGFWHWLNERKSRQMVVWGLCMAVGLLALISPLLRYHVPGMNWQKALSTGVVLLLGGFGDVFGGLQLDPVPPWLQLLCLLVALFSLFFFLGILGLVAEKILSPRFALMRSWRSIPRENHVVLVGMGRVGQRVACLLKQFRQPVVGVVGPIESLDTLPDIPVITGNILRGIAKAHLAKAKSLIIVTEDQMLNLEIALMARETAQREKRELGLVIRTFDRQYTDNLSQLLPDSRFLCAYELSAEAFVGAAFGENILGLFRLQQRTVLVTEYNIVTEDTLTGKTLAQVAYGYGVAPIFHQRLAQSCGEQTEASVLPADDIRLQPGDRLVVLSTMNGMRRIERGDLAPPCSWRLSSGEAVQTEPQLVDVLAGIVGCSSEEARNLLLDLPSGLELSLYPMQARRLQRALSRQVSLRMVQA